MAQKEGHNRLDSLQRKKLLAYVLTDHGCQLPRVGHQPALATVRICDPIILFDFNNKVQNHGCRHAASVDIT